MAEALFKPQFFVDDLIMRPDKMPDDTILYLLYRATALAVESALRFGQDMPVGAVAMSRRWITGMGMASDVRTGNDWEHAETRALANSALDGHPNPHTLAVSLEPCIKICLPRIAQYSSIDTVYFAAPRTEIESRKLANERSSVLREIARGRKNPPYEVVHMEDPFLYRVNGILFDHVSREPGGSTVNVDKVSLREQLLAEPGFYPALAA